jgi:hypothetical protein
MLIPFNGTINTALNMIALGVGTLVCMWINWPYIYLFNFEYQSTNIDNMYTDVEYVGVHYCGEWEPFYIK